MAVLQVLNPNHLHSFKFKFLQELEILKKFSITSMLTYKFSLQPADSEPTEYI